MHARIRPATPGDLTAIADIFAHYVRTSVATFEEVPPGSEAWAQRLVDLAGSGVPLLVADLDGEVGGYAYASAWRPKPAYRHTVEDSVYVDHQRHGQGLGHQLLGELLARCRQAGRTQVVAVIADTGHPASQALHRAHGFREVGRLRAVGFKHGRWVDTILMQCDLGSAAT